MVEALPCIKIKMLARHGLLFSNCSNKLKIKYFTKCLPVISVSESFRKRIVIDFQLSDLENIHYGIDIFNKITLMFQNTVSN